MADPKDGAKQELIEANTITSVMNETRKFNPSKAHSEKAYIKSLDEYHKLYKQSIEQPDVFWADRASELHWFKKWDKVHESNFAKAQFKWFIGGKLNASYNCLDRHMATKTKDKVAIIWEGDSGETRKYTYADLYKQVNKMANVIKKLGVKKGDRVTIYLPMIPELPMALLACARIGAIHSVIFGGFSAEAIIDRVQDSQSSFLITSDGGFRGGKNIPMKETVDKALAKCPTIKKVLVVNHAKVTVPMTANRDYWWHEMMNDKSIPDICKPEEMDAEDPLFILYTSGSTGKPKGVLHTTGGYTVYTYLTFKYIFDCHDDDIFWCTADIGWVTGHTYVVYGPLAAGSTEVMFEGIPTYPKPDRFWEAIEKHKVTVFYTAPTAIRALASFGNEWTAKHPMPSLRILGSVGEPINPGAWDWYYKTIGGSRCPIMDTWWQTETGGFMITPLPITPLKPGSATKPFFGNEVAVVDDHGNEVGPNEEGSLVIKTPWPGMARTIYGDDARYKETYWKRYESQGWYVVGDSAKKDEDGYFWIIGRIDDVLKVSGYRLGTAEIESALVSHPAVSEAAAVGLPHELKGNAIHCYVILTAGFQPSEALEDELKNQVGTHLGKIATPEKIDFVDGLPKTRSGKIMRRVLKARALGQDEGDLSTLEE